MLDKFPIPGGTIESIVKIDKPNLNYLLLEAEPDLANDNRIVHVIYLNRKSILEFVILNNYRDVDMKLILGFQIYQYRVFILK